MAYLSQCGVSEATFLMRIENVLQLDATVESPACYLMREPLSSDSSHQVRQREWRGEVRPTFFDGVKQLFITVSCNNCREQMGEEVEEGENPSECHATFKVALINQCDSKHTIREQFTTVFSSSNSRGVSGVGLSLDWQTFIDPSAGFVLGDAAFVRINIRVPSGVPDPTGLTQSAAAGAGVRSGDGAGCSAEVAAPFAGLRRHLRGSVRKRKKKKRSKRPRVPSSSDTDDDTNSSGSISPTVRRLKRPKLGSVDSDLPETPVNVLALNARARDDNCTNAAHDSNEVIASGSSSPDPISTSSSIDGVETAGVSTPQSTSGGSDVAESSSPSPVAVCSHSGDNPNNSPYCPTISAIRHKSSQTDNESETIAESDKIVDGLRCAICLNLFEAPIYLCRTGHSICSKCILRLDKCPSCKNRFLTHTRNFSLEGLTQHVFFPCNSIGCDNSYLLTQRRSHLMECVHRVIKCFFHDCSYRMAVKEYKQHLETKHPDRLIRMVEGRFEKFTFPLETFDQIRYSYTMTFDGEIFQVILNNSGRIFYVCVQLIGSARLAERYQFATCLPRSDRQGAVFHQVHSYLEKKDSVCVELISEEQLRNSNMLERERELTVRCYISKVARCNDSA